MFAYAHMLAHMDGHKIRPVLIPDDERGETPQATLSRAFYYGQNDFQPSREHCSVIAGDVLDIGDGSLHLVRYVGFRKLTAEEFAAYLATPRQDRLFHDLLLGKR